MKFGTVPTLSATGAILAHSLKVSGKTYRKGQALSAQDVDIIAQNHAEITVAQLDADDVAENEAAARLASTLCGKGLHVAPAFTGRANLIATVAGVFRASAEIAEINSVDEAITLATLPDYTRVVENQMVATIKIIPYGVPERLLCDAVAATGGALSVHMFTPLSVSLILTETPGMKPGLTDKAKRTIGDRLTSLNLSEVETFVTPHTIKSVAEHIKSARGDLVLILGGSATSDRRDVCPASVREAGGQITRFGMPVDPGNLLFLGEVGTRTVIGLPGCARSPALNGMDWVLERLVAGLPVTSKDIAAMGEGGLLKEIPSRPQPRQP